MHDVLHVVNQRTFVLSSWLAALVWRADEHSSDGEEALASMIQQKNRNK